MSLLHRELEPTKNDQLRNAAHGTHEDANANDIQGDFLWAAQNRDMEDKTAGRQ